MSKSPLHLYQVLEEEFFRIIPAGSNPDWTDERTRLVRLGLTDDKNSYVYLSDGGHFENLGLYEMYCAAAG